MEGYVREMLKTPIEITLVLGGAFACDLRNITHSDKLRPDVSSF